MANKISQVLSFEAADAITALGQVKTGLDDVESAGKTVALALDQAATDIEANLKGSAAAADALGAALGPELAGKIGRSGVEDFVVKLKGIGLTSDQIITDVDSLAASIKRLDAIKVDGPNQSLHNLGDSAEHARTGIEKVGHEADNSRSVLANMAGNSTQDLAQIGGAAGTAGMALGQMAEYATEGNISLSGLGKVVGPMAAITVATMALTQGAKQAAEAEKKLTEEIGNLSTASDKQVLASLTQMMIDQFVAGKDLADIWTRIAEGNTEGARRLVDLMQAQGMTTEQTKGLTDALAAHDDGVRRSSELHKQYGDDVVNANDRAVAATSRYDAQVATTSADVQREIDAMTAKWDEINGHINAEKSMIQYKQQVDGVRQAIADAGQAELDHGVGSPEAIAAREAARLKTLELESTTASLGATILGLPPEQVTKLIAEIDRGNLDNLPGIIQSKLDERTYRIKAHLDSIVIDGETHAAGSTTLSVGGTQKTIHSAAGGYFPPRPGGYTVNLAEAGKGEWVVPEDQMRGGGGPGGPVTIVNVYVAGSVMAERDLARSVADGIVDGQRRGEITAGFLVSP